MNRIRELRMREKLTLKQLGEVVGCSESAMSLYERGKRQPDNDVLFCLASYFHVSLDYLVGRIGKKPSKQEGGLKEKVINRLNDLSEEELHVIDDYITVALSKHKGL